VPGLFLVRQARGPAWDPNRRRREQDGWEEHAAFIDLLSDRERVLLAGPVGDIDGTHVMLVVRAATAAEARGLFDRDPWMGTVLQIERVEPWTVWVGAERFAAPD
jgi:uncharacterized protein YciI